MNEQISSLNAVASRPEQRVTPDYVFVVAEIGINHNGSMDIAKRLIDHAKQAGCDAVKFQKRTIDLVYTPEFLAAERESPWGTTQREQKEALEFSRAEYDEIDAYCRELGIEWFASAWDIESLRFLAKYDLRHNKVASAMNTHVPFLEEVAAAKRSTFISTGMCETEDVDRAVENFRRAECPFVLMHSVSTYPAEEEDLNLRCIDTLRERYGCPVGYSGHEVSVSPSFVAAMMGVVAIERHITVNRSMYGSDQAASLEVNTLTRLVTMIRKIPVVLGDGAKRFSDKERLIAQKLRYWE